MNLANKITIIRMCLIPFFMLAYQQYPSWMADEYPIINYVNEYGVYWAVSIFIIASATDKLDGYIARKYNMVTNLGKLLDPLADKLLVSAALIMMVQHNIIPSWIAVVIIGREIFVSSIRILAAARGIALAADKHGKVKLVLQVVGIAAVLLGNYPFTYFTDFPVDYSIMMVAVILTVYSGYNYTKNNYKELNLEF
ncbi:CDP-diacylglycerol--glycerol-3-phosphate 3-phosphatidyltransferase [Paenibacillus sp. SC116]|uniref:CDP-diacylglycerol--glycerol-3-phosphate 3-phosphatidyltransferase n=1 Tax=Paenibacillus sp. SC116 TaxID=2968986 RepID=UPI00215AD75E|nr:CDP-diacylglycerol--glycerol-3-phosphate 3-phosphatidyltransferase [Paenibacillus sp. SC116]MCR8844291.1 CDP-diacylglycerol--glycerol-3-phosphate 3-phosphatidyltransferase [Paenibacillus sp. SC116]